MTVLKTVDFYYDLPEELIAVKPALRREESRLMVVDQKEGSISHFQFSDVEKFLCPEDLLVLNNSKVIPGLLHTVDQKFEVLLMEETSPRHWVVLIKPGRKAKQGFRMAFCRKRGERIGEIIEAEVLKTLPGGERVLRFYGDFDAAGFGGVPLPPYILKRRQGLGMEAETAEDWERYQTVYAQEEGSVAAPTAGLHLTTELLARVRHGFVTLHVGLGTFRPVKTEKLEDHEMHEEAYSIPVGLSEQVAAARRVVAVGTTSARVLEGSLHLEPHSGKTRIFIHEPYRFRRVGALITNFHLPRSTLFMLVCAFGGRTLIMEAYRQAVAERYRFFSYGDAMLVV